MKALLSIAVIACLLFSCGGGEHKPTNDTTIVSPPVNGADTGIDGPHLKPDGTPIQGDTATNNNAQNRNVDTSRRNP